MEVAQRSGNSAETWFSVADSIWNRMGSSTSTMVNIGMGLPQHIENLYDTATFLVNYAQSENLDLPADATAMVEMTDW